MMFANDKNYIPSLKSQLIISYMAMSFIILLIGSFYVYFGIMSMLKAKSERSTLQQFHQAEYNINNLIDEVDRVSKLILIDEKFQNLINGECSSEIERIDLANELFRNVSVLMLNYSFVDSIYIYGESGIILGITTSSNDYLNDPSKKNGFYKSQLYNEAKAKNYGLVWSGGLTSSDFDIFDYKNNEKANYYVTAARCVKPLSQAVQKATLVINIDERKFTSNYNNSSGVSESNMYLMENNGKIISNSDINKIGDFSAAIYSIKSEKEFDSFTLQSGINKEQVIYYRLVDTGWMLVNEIPFNEFAKDTIFLRRFIAYMVGLSLIAAFLLSLYWIYRITKPLKPLTSAMRQMQNGQLGVILEDGPRNELGLLGRQFNKMSASIAELMSKNKAVEEEKRKQQIEALQAQINPHFIYNTLNTIKWMAVVADARNVEDSLTVLGNILRPIFKDHNVLCSLKEELDYAGNYIKIMNYRYGECITVLFDIPPELLECMVLRFILQPLIENALTHGIPGQNYMGKINITAVEKDNEINLIISDNGRGMTPEKLKEVKASLFVSNSSEAGESKKVGIININQRIKLHFGINYGLDIESVFESGSIVTLRLPKVPKL